MSKNLRRLALRAGAVIAVAATAVLASAAPAFAHVTAQPGTAEQGGYAVVTFRVPNESDTAGTVKVEIKLPTDTPFSSVRTTPIPGWTATLTKTALNPPVEIGAGRTLTEAVSLVTFTAAPGTRIGPGQYLDFPVSLGRMPKDRDSVTFPTIQTYDNGEVVAWDQPTPAGGAEPERPAPTVKLTPATGGGHGSGDTPEKAAGHDGGEAPTAVAATGGDTGSDTGSDTTARWLGGAGLVVGALGLGVGGGALLRSRKQSAGS
ncbi:MAG: YcnI family protein [Pseudonocardia sp.]|nr:YcnI family protein [Pseudonocardia sp.]